MVKKCSHFFIPSLKCDLLNHLNPPDPPRPTQQNWFRTPAGLDKTLLNPLRKFHCYSSWVDTFNTFTHSPLSLYWLASFWVSYQQDREGNRCHYVCTPGHQCSEQCVEFCYFQSLDEEGPLWMRKQQSEI